MRAMDVPAHAAHIGERVMALWRNLGAKHRLPVRVPESYPSLAHFAFDHPLANELRTLYTQLMLGRGFLAGPAIYPTLGHTDAIVSAFGEAMDATFAELAETLAKDALLDRLAGPPAHQGFRRLL
jgi:glutamate-1-semialdehyde 2,1-aminomutase